MPTLADFARVLKALGSGVASGAAGWPMDTAVGAGNLARAAYGYGGNKLGLLKAEDMPELIEPGNIPGTSEYISQKLGVGDTTEEQIAQFIGSMAAPGPKGAKKPPTKQELITYHGTPKNKKFDKFDDAYIGTGEGAQAYGHGHYVAEHPNTAGQYMNMRSESREFLDGPLDWDNPIHVAIRASDLGGGREAGIARLTETVKAKSADAINKDVARKAIEFLKSDEPFDKYARSGGSFYSVDLPDEQIAKMMHWDRPWAQQPENVRQALGPIAQQRMLPGDDRLDELTGSDLYNLMSRDPKEASAALRMAGVPGIRYLDNQSRMTGHADMMVEKYGTREKALEAAQERLAKASFGDLKYWDDIVRDLSKRQTSNFVVFDPTHLNIIGAE